ncbi:hypothetical protein JKP88DRAFT_252695 [Tribonema minus]|uniref:Uncharacterized protein n=1 Tax=Tribonema minus TaxID=303371 RepID=A0A836CLK1_9STRA|nr:hypothetical protein JKP88DRAFT_253668 [Tribonema minus]KAG5189864.1 hypothetical protein JKP88DRAFT_252695 [Tribonema minus]
MTTQSLLSLPLDSNVYISSTQSTRTGAYHNDVEVVVPRPIIAADGYSLRMSLHSMTLPNTQTCINLYNNSPSISGLTKVLEPGNYSASTLASALATAFPARSVSFNVLTSKMTFSSPTTMSISGSMCSVLDIAEGSSGIVLSSQNNVDLSASQIVYVYSSLGVDSLDTTPARKRGLLASIQNTVGPLAVLHYSDPDGRQGGLISDRTYNALHAALRDCCTSQDMVRTRDSITLGSDPTRLRSPVPNVYGTTTSLSFTIPLVSVIGTLSNTERYLPLHALSAPLRLDLELANASTAIASGGTAAATAATYAVTNVTLDCQYVTLADDAHRAIVALTNNRYDWSSSQWRMYRTVHSAGQLSNAILIPSRVTSMKSRLIAQRESAAEYDISKSSVTQRLRNNLRSYQVRCGSQYINATPVSCIGSALPAYVETTKVFSNPASESGCGLFASDSWTVDGNVPPTSTSVEGSFLAGVELEAFSNQTKLISG